MQIGMWKELVGVPTCAKVIINKNSFRKLKAWIVHFFHHPRSSSSGLVLVSVFHRRGLNLSYPCLLIGFHWKCSFFIVTFFFLTIWTDIFKLKFLHAYSTVIEHLIYHSGFTFTHGKVLYVKFPRVCASFTFQSP